MSESDHQPSSEERTTAPDPRYAELEVGEELVIYDRQNHQAWLQSDGAVDTESMA